MQPENLKLGGGAAASVMHPVVMIALLLAILFILLMPRRNAIVPLLVIAFLVPLGQQVAIGGVHVLALRIVILFAVIRGLLAARNPEGQKFAGGFGVFDGIFVTWTLYHVIAFLVLFAFVSAAWINQSGFLWDILGGYLAARLLIQDETDIQRVIRTLAYISVILAMCMLTERFFMLNVFGLLGGDTRIVPEMRDGLVRAQATFSHPLLAGTFGATLMPLFILYWHSGKSKLEAMMGAISATVMVICASSSTPLLAYAAGIGAVCFWPFRKQMRLFRWGIVIALVTMQLVMKAPVWFVISHISLFGSSSSDHRAYLVDVFIKHFSDWWLVGTNAAGTWGWDMWDTSNQYVAEGESGGLVAFVCFIAMISNAFGRIGKARKAVEGDLPREKYFWILGAALFSHAIGFFGISYFDQTRMAWIVLLVMILAATAPVLLLSKKTELQPVAPGLDVPREISDYPWLSAPASKATLGQPGHEFKPRQS